MARTSYPAACSVATSPLQLEASAQAPWTRTTTDLACPAGRHVSRRCTSEDSVTPPCAVRVAAAAAVGPLLYATSATATAVTAGNASSIRRRAARLLLRCAPSPLPR